MTLERILADKVKRNSHCNVRLCMFYPNAVTVLARSCANKDITFGIGTGNFTN